MTAVLAAFARAALGAVLVLAAFASLLWVAYGPQGLWTPVWLAVVFAVVTGAGLVISALQPKGRGPGPERLSEEQLEAARRLAAETLAADHLAIERSALRPKGVRDRADTP